jgi:hypothetical protein
MITCQYIYQIPPVIRNNCDFIYVGQMNNQSLKLLTDEFLMGSIDKKVCAISLGYIAPVTLSNRFTYHLLGSGSVEFISP